MLAVLAEPPLTGVGLVYEPKYDGIRAIALVEPATPVPAVHLWSRQGNDKTAQFADVAGALAEWGRGFPGPVVLDGEIVALDAGGRPAGFQQLQRRMHIKVPGYQSRTPIVGSAQQPAAFIAFDVLRVDGEDLRAQPLSARRTVLETLFAERPPASHVLRISVQVANDGRSLYAQAEAEGWEGLIVKHARSPYRTGKRSPEWRKLKLLRQDDFVIGGWTEPRGSRARFGALILGVPDGARLRYVGDVGTGFTDAGIDQVWQRVSALESKESPFGLPPKTMEKAHWVRPSLKARVRYAEMTNEGRLRHPVYLGIVDDNGAGAAPAGGQASRPAAGTGAAGSRTGADATPDSPETQALVAQLDDLEHRRKNGRLTLPDGTALDVTNLHKVFWPDIPRTKGDLLRYYARMAPYILPVIADRPLVMKRLPNGVSAKAFYQHRAPEPIPDGVRVETLPDDDVPARLVGGTLATLLYMAQLASISMDPWFSTMPALDRADQVAIDLDPQPGCPFDRVLDVARWVRDELGRAGVAAFPKTSGSEGVHIFIPLPPGTPYDAGMLFCQIVATIVATRHPKAATVERTVRRRKAGTVYVDYLQNIQGKTLACAYSARGSAFAGVSAPLRWEELDGGIRPEDFTIDTIPARVAAVGDLWAGLRDSPGADLIAALERLR